MFARALPLPPGLAGRFAWLFDRLCRAIGVHAQERGVQAALAWAMWNRVRLLGERLVALGGAGAGGGNAAEAGGAGEQPGTCLTL